MDDHHPADTHHWLSDAVSVTMGVTHSAVSDKIMILDCSFAHLSFTFFRFLAHPFLFLTS